jgi:surface protein
MFRGASAFDQDLSHFQTSLVTDFSEMFFQAATFNKGISKWDMQSAKYLNDMFQEAGSFRQNLCAWNKYGSHFENVYDLFWATNCPTPGDPDLEASPAGPFCYSCLPPPEGSCMSDTDCLLLMRNNCPTCPPSNKCTRQAINQCCSSKPSSAYAKKVRDRYRTVFCGEPIQGGCFLNKTELREAVLAYYANSTKQSPVAKKYGVSFLPKIDPLVPIVLLKGLLSLYPFSIQ